jgi:GNAT superfamily N-acetyltransferase
MTWELRPMREDDRNYVLSSWLNSYAEVGRRPRLVDPRTRELQDEGGEFRGTRRGVYFRVYQPIVEALVGRSTIVVATLPEEPDVVLGWMAVEGDCLHYLLVKPRWRRLGIARWLIEQLDGMNAVYTHAPSPTVAKGLVPSSWSFDSMRRFEDRKAA